MMAGRPRRDRPDGLIMNLGHTQDIAAGQQHGVIVVSHPMVWESRQLRFPHLSHGLLDLRAGQVIFHLLVSGGFKHHTAICCDIRVMRRSPLTNTES